MSDFKLTDAQKETLREFIKTPGSEMERCEKLGVDAETFDAFMKAEMKEKVLQQDLSHAELENISGGAEWKDFCMRMEERNCAMQERRDIDQCDHVQKGFPNCAKTVEDGSRCDKGDACWSSAVRYQHMKSCWISYR